MLIAFTYLSRLASNFGNTNHKTKSVFPGLLRMTICKLFSFGHQAICRPVYDHLRMTSRRYIVVKAKKLFENLLEVAFITLKGDEISFH